MKTKLIIKLIVLSVLVILIATFATTSFAKINPASLVPSLSPTAPGNVEAPIGKIIGGVQAFGAIVAVVVLIIIGIMYVTAAPEGKMQLKGRVLPYMIGAVLLFATTTVVTIIYNIFSK